MASPKMVDMRQLNPQQLTEVAQRIDTELQVLQNCQNELLSGKSCKLILPNFKRTECVVIKMERLKMLKLGKFRFWRLKNRKFCKDVFSF